MQRFDKEIGPYVRLSLNSHQSKRALQLPEANVYWAVYSFLISRMMKVRRGLDQNWQRGVLFLCQIFALIFFMKEEGGVVTTNLSSRVLCQ